MSWYSTELASYLGIRGYAHTAVPWYMTAKKSWRKSEIFIKFLLVLGSVGSPAGDFVTSRHINDLLVDAPRTCFPKQKSPVRELISVTGNIIEG